MRTSAKGYQVLHLSALSEEVHADVHGLSEQEWKLAFARTTIGFTKREGGAIAIEENVYGAAILIPQVARTLNWDKIMVVLTAQALFFCALNIFLQAYLLKMIAKEEEVMDKFAGQVSLCDFGVGKDRCPGPGCTGPGGTDVTPARLYDFESYALRQFVHASFKALFPDRASDIDDLVDIGEYGVESYWCRLICCFIFVIPMLEELGKIFKMYQLLYKIPSQAECWVKPKVKGDNASLKGSLDEVTILVAGMSWWWKLFNAIGVLGCQLLLWRLTTEIGISFLMETSTIDDIIINSVALTFIVNLDELIGHVLMNEEILKVINACEEVELWDEATSCVGNMALLGPEELLEAHRQAQSWKTLGCRDWIALIPRQLCLTILLTAIVVAGYYWKHCDYIDDHGVSRLVSKTVYTPTSTTFTWLNAWFPMAFEPPHEETPTWTMPGQT